MKINPSPTWPGAQNCERSNTSPVFASLQAPWWSRSSFVKLEIAQSKVRIQKKVFLWEKVPLIHTLHIGLKKRDFRALSNLFLTNSGHFAFNPQPTIFSTLKRFLASIPNPLLSSHIQHHDVEHQHLFQLITSSHPNSTASFLSNLWRPCFNFDFDLRITWLYYDMIVKC